MTKRFQLSLSCILFHYALLFGQSASITGKVVSGNQPVPFATVGLEGTTLGTVADLEGFFDLKNIPEGSYTLSVNAVGFGAWTKDLTIAKDTSIALQVLLREDLLNLEEVVVSGTRYAYDRSNAPVVVNVVDNKLLNATQSLAVSEGLNFQPGVRVETNCQNCGFTQVRMNGLQGGYSQILINSRPIFSALNSVYGLDQIPTNIIDRIEVVRSGGSALYGSNAIAGTINIITKEPVENTWEIRSNTALIDGDALDHTFNYNGSIVNENLTSGITFYGMNRGRNSYDANGDGFTELVRLESSLLGTKAFFEPTEQSKITFDFSTLNEYRRGGDRLELAPHFTDITEELTHRTFFGGLNYELWNKDKTNKIAIYGSLQRTERDSYYGGLGGGRTAEDSLLAISAYGITDDLAFVGGAQFNKYLTNNDVITIGVENQHYSTRDDIQGYERIIDQEVNNVGIFGQYEWKPTFRFTTLLGARYDITQVDGLYQVGDIQNTADVDAGIFSPRVTLLYNVTENLRLRGGYARGFRAPQAFNEDLHISSVGGEPQFVVLSNDLDNELSDAFTASINYTKSERLIQRNLLIEGFYTQLNNPFTQVSTGSVLANGSIVKEVRNGEGARVYGVNIEAGYSPSDRLVFQLGGTLQRTRYNESQLLFESDGASETGENNVTIDEFARTPDLYGFFTSYYAFTDAFNVDITGSYTGGMVVPRVVSESGFLQLIESDPFLDVNIKGSYQFGLADDFMVEVSGGVKNVFNSFQNDFESGPERDSDFIFGPAAPRSIFISIKIGNFN